MNHKKPAMITWALCLLPFTLSLSAATRSFSYDLNGNVVAVTDAKESSTQYFYDKMNRKIGVQYPNGDKVTFAYDERGNKIEMKDRLGTTRYRYNDKNQLTEILFRDSEKISYGYDDSGNISKIIYPDLEEVLYTYDEHNRITSLKDATGTTSYSYDPAINKLKKISYSNGIATEYNYDEMLRICNLEHRGKEGDLIESFKYRYDLQDQPIFVERVSQEKTLSASYSYDRLGRVVSIAYSDGSFENYSYDALGNIITKKTALETIDYQYGADNQLIRVGQTELTYDAQGNLIKKHSPTSTTTYEYDHENRLIAFNKDKHLVTFDYDGLGARILKTVNGKKTTYLNDAEGHLMMEMTSDREESRWIKSKYRYGKDLVSQTRSDGTLFYLYDNQKNVASVISSNEKLCDSYQYNLLGKIIHDDHTLTNSIGWEGAILDRETGLLSINGRYYDPKIGRFLTKENRLGDLKNPLSWNSYVYQRDKICPDVIPAPLFEEPLSSSYQAIPFYMTEGNLSQIQELWGATFDEKTGQLILFGKESSKTKALSLDELIFAIGANDSLINDYEKVFQTPLGKFIYEADLSLKNLDMGFDYFNETALRVPIAGYESSMDRYLAHNYIGQIDQKVWLFPEQIRSEVSTKSSLFLIDNILMQATAEAKFNDLPINQKIAQGFARHFSENYDAYAAQFPVFANLINLERGLAIAKWVKDFKIPFDWSLFSDLPSTAGYLETLTPASKKNKYPLVDGVHYRRKYRRMVENNTLTLSESGALFCGLNGRNFSFKENEGLIELKEQLLDARPKDDTFLWKSADFIATAQATSKTAKVGNCVKKFVDMSLPVLGKNRLELTRIYDSFQGNWRFSPAALEFNDKGIFVYLEDEVYLFTQVNNTLYRSEKSRATLQKGEDGSFSLKQEDGSKLTFNSTGKVVKKSDPFGISISYEYQDGKLSSITHEKGRSIRLFYQDGKMVRAVGPGNRTLYYNYDQWGRLHTVADSRWKLATYLYDDENRLTAIYDAKDQKIFSLSYDIYDRVTEELDGRLNLTEKSYNLRERTAVIKSPADLIISQHYDPLCRLVCVYDNLNRHINFTYASGSSLPASITDSLGNRTLYEYDQKGHLIVKKDPTGLSTRFFYDEKGTLVAIQDPQGVKQFVEKSQCTYDDYGQLISQVDPNGLKTSFSYDENGMLIEERDSTGIWSKRTYDDRSRLIRIVNSTGTKMEYNYDDRDQLVRYKCGGKQIGYMYDDNGNVTRITDALGYESAFDYDAANNLIVVTDAEGMTTRYEYNALNQLQRVILPNGTIHEIIYDAGGRPISEISA